MPTAGELLAGSRLARNEAAMLLAAACGVDRVVFIAHPERTVDAISAQRFVDWSVRREAGEPIAYLLGLREFYGLDFAVDAYVLIPRHETEMLVDLALEHLGDRASSVLDLGTGSGAIAVSIAKHRPHATMTAVDQSMGALDVARSNAERHGARVEFLVGDWFAPLVGRGFDLIVSNPPYIEDADAHLEQGDLRFEPRAALASGTDGLDAIRVIVRDAPRHLNAGGLLALEHGFDQAERVRALLQAAGFVPIESRRDLSGHERIALGRWD
jgi:release factor glutamine methyltransferase